VEAEESLASVVSKTGRLGEVTVDEFSYRCQLLDEKHNEHKELYYHIDGHKSVSSPYVDHTSTHRWLMMLRFHLLPEVDGVRGLRGPLVVGKWSEE